MFAEKSNEEELFQIKDPFTILSKPSSVAQNETQSEPAALVACSTNELQKSKINLKKSSTNEPQKINKEKQIHFRLSNEEYNTVITQMGLSEYTNVSQFCRDCATKKRLKKTNKLDLDKQNEIVKLMRNLANNVNQIAKHANQTHDIDDLAEIRKEMRKLWQLVQ